MLRNKTERESKRMGNLKVKPKHSRRYSGFLTNKAVTVTLFGGGEHLPEKSTVITSLEEGWIPSPGNLEELIDPEALRKVLKSHHLGVIATRC